MADRKLPHNLEAEQSVLGGVLVDCEAAGGVFQIVTADDFYSPRHSRIFQTMVDVFDRHSTVDEILLQAELERKGSLEECGGIEYLDELINRLPSAANSEHYARIVHEKAILRSLVNTCSQVVDRVFESDLPAQEQQDRAEQEVFEIGERESGRTFVPIQEIIDQQFEQLDQEGAGDEGVPSGFLDLDSMTTGFHPSELIIVAGRPSMGKTSFSMNVVENASMAGKRVAVFTLEVSRDQLVRNLLCSFSKVDSHRLRQRSLSREDWSRLVDGASRLRQAGIFVDDAPGLSSLALKARARRLDHREKLDLIVIDYLQLMEGSGADNRQQEISEISRSLKALARELSVPVLAISQLSRGVENREDRRPRMSDLRESGAIEQDADLILLLYRHEYYHEGDEEAKGKAEVIVAKQRNGPTGTVELTFLKSFMRFENLSTEREDAF